MDLALWTRFWNRFSGQTMLPKSHFSTPGNIHYVSLHSADAARVVIAAAEVAFSEAATWSITMASKEPSKRLWKNLKWSMWPYSFSSLYPAFSYISVDYDSGSKGVTENCLNMYIGTNQCFGRDVYLLYKWLNLYLCLKKYKKLNSSSKTYRFYKSSSDVSALPE